MIRVLVATLVAGALGFGLGFGVAPSRPVEPPAVAAPTVVTRFAACVTSPAPAPPVPTAEVTPPPDDPMPAPDPEPRRQGVLLLDRAEARGRWTGEDEESLRAILRDGDDQVRAELLLRRARAINDQRLHVDEDALFR